MEHIKFSEEVLKELVRVTNLRVTCNYSNNWLENNILCGYKLHTAKGVCFTKNLDDPIVFNYSDKWYTYDVKQNTVNTMPEYLPPICPIECSIIEYIPVGCLKYTGIVTFVEDKSAEILDKIINKLLEESK